MSFDRLPSLEAQPTTARGSGYSDSPEFDSLTNKLSSQLFTLTSNISRLNRELSLVGTKRDSESLRERVKKLLDETREGFKAVGEGVKRVQNWQDVSVSLPPVDWRIRNGYFQGGENDTDRVTNVALATLHSGETLARNGLCPHRLSDYSAPFC